jgi:dTMP kinase
MQYPFLVSFSGLDGSGKSQLIVLLRRFLRRQGIPYTCIHTVRDSFDNRLAKRYPSLKAFAKTRENMDDISAAPSQEIKRISFLSFCLRALAILIYSLHLRIQLAALKKEFKIIIFDRYVYDKVVNIAYLRPKTSLGLLNFLVKCFPRPNLPLFLHVTPEQSMERKKESILEGQDSDYFQKKYALFERSREAWKLLMIDNSTLSISEAKKKMLSLLKKRYYKS